LLRRALAGAKAKGAMTEFVHLYDLSFRGCVSCFACKKIGGKSYGRCAVRDELTPLLTKAAEADVLILAHPSISTRRPARCARSWSASCSRT